MSSNSKKRKSIFSSPLMSSKIKSSGVSLFPEASLGYLIGPMLALLSNGVVNIWLIQYWDKVLMLGRWNSLYETLLPIFSSILIVIGNLSLGKLMEKKPTMAGKARPFILLGMPLVALSLFALFIVPLPVGDGCAVEIGGTGGSFSNLWASIIIAIGYNLYYAFAWPIYFTSHSSLVNLSTRDEKKRSLLSTCVMAAQLGAAGLSGMAGGVLVDLMGLLPVYYVSSVDKNFSTYEEALASATGMDDVVVKITPSEANSKWTILMIIMIAALIIGCLLEYYFTRERITEESQSSLEKGKAEDEADDQKGVPMSLQAKICLKDKYWWIIIIFFFLYQFGGQMKNNDLSFYSQAFTGGTSLSSFINILGAIPTTLGMFIVAPLANKFSKSKTIAGGAFLAFLASLLSLLCLLPEANDGLIWGISVASFMIKALGTAPAMYISLALLANVLDHQEALYGKRTDGLSMAVYGSIMVAMSGISNGIIAGFNSLGSDGKIVHTVLGYIVEGACYLTMGTMFLFMNVERFIKIDNKTIVDEQRERAKKEGKEWLEPEEKADKEEAEKARLAEQARLAELSERCAKKGLDFETENAKFLEEKAKKDAAMILKKMEKEKKKAAREAAKKGEFDALEETKKAAILEKEKAEEAKIEAEFAALKAKAKKSGLAV